MLARIVADEFAAAARGLARSPGFAALAVAVLSLGIGAIVFMFGVVEALLLRAPPYPDAERIYFIHGRSAETGRLTAGVAQGDYRALAAVEGPFAAMGSVYNGTVYVTGDGPAARYDGGFVTAGVFDVAGVPPALGRVIVPADEAPGAPPVVVLGHRLWQERFDGDPGVLGRTIRVNGADARIVGVMPENFVFPVAQSLWLPAHADPAGGPAETSLMSIMVAVRLAPGVTADEAQQALLPLAARPSREAALPYAYRAYELLWVGGRWVGETGQSLLLWLLAAVGLILLIACANVSNLILSRAAWRMRESGVRAALGATRARLVLHVVAESLLISLTAASLGLLIAALGLDALAYLMPRMVEDAPPWIDLRINLPVVAAAAGAALVAALLAGLPAALRATRPALDAVLRDGGRTGTGRAVGRLAWSLVVAEVALAAAVLGGAALMVRTVLLVTHADLGIDTSELMTARVGIPVDGLVTDVDAKARAERRLRDFHQRYLEELSREPGVASAGLVMALPGHEVKLAAFAVEGVEYAGRESMPRAGGMSLSPSAFETLRVRPLAGRLLEDTDTADGEPVVVINESLARLAWPGKSPLGRRLRSELPGDTWRTVVGVVPDHIQDVERGRPEPFVYLPLAQAPQNFVSVLARGDAGPAGLAAAMQRAIERADPELALYWVRTLDEALALRTSGFRVIGGMSAVFGVVALVLAATGLYGVLSFHVAQRNREIGLRRALGASDGKVLLLMLRTSGTQVVLGLALGLAAVPVLERVLERLLIWLSPGSAWVYIGVLGVMLATAAAAIARPTLLSLRIDPAAALRQD